MALKLKVKPNWKEFRHPAARYYPGRWYRWGDLSVCVGDREREGHWHISISHPYRHPTWEGIKAAWYELVPGAGEDFEGAILLPRRSEYVNIHQNCFHVHQLREAEVPIIDL